MRFWLLLLLSACGPAEPESSDGGTDAGQLTGALSVGGGTPDTGYQPLPEGADVTLEPGSQGGFHVYLHLRFDAAGAQSLGATPFVAITARRASDRRLVSRLTERQIQLNPQGDGADSAALLLFMCPTPAGVAVGDEAIDVEVNVSRQRGGATLSGTKRLTPRCPDGAQSAFCRNICFG